MSDLIEAIFARARYQGVPLARLADKAGLRPETLSRLKSRDNFDWRTLNSLALGVGCRLELVPLDAASDKVYSPRENARAKVEARKRDEAAIAAGRVSTDEAQRRSGFFSLPRAKFPLKGLDADER